MTRKLAESKVTDDEGENLHASIMAHGVQEPVHLAYEKGGEGRSQVAEGNHRLAVGLDKEKTTGKSSYIPVIHHETVDDVGNWYMDNL